MSNFGKTIGKFVDKIKGTEKPKTNEQAYIASTSHPNKVYLRAMPLRNLDDVETVKKEVKSGNILILRIRPLAKKNIEAIKQAIDRLCKFTESVGGDIARLGEERVVITPSFVRIWREKTVGSREGTPTAA